MGDETPEAYAGDLELSRLAEILGGSALQIQELLGGELTAGALSCHSCSPLLGNP